MQRVRPTVGSRNQSGHISTIPRGLLCTLKLEEPEPCDTAQFTLWAYSMSYIHNVPSLEWDQCLARLNFSKHHVNA